MDENDIFLYAKGLLLDQGYPFFCVGNIDKGLSIGEHYFLPIFYCPGKSNIRIDIGKYIRINKIDIADYELPTEKEFDSIVDQYINDYFTTNEVAKEVMIQPYDVHLELRDSIAEVMELNSISKKLLIKPKMSLKVMVALEATERLMKSIENIAMTKNDRIFIDVFISRDRTLLYNLIAGHYHHNLRSNFSIVRDNDLDEIINLYKALILQIYSHYYQILANNNSIVNTILKNAPLPEMLVKEKIDFINPVLNTETVLVPKGLDLYNVTAETILNCIKSYATYKAWLTKKKEERIDTTKPRDII